MTLTIIGFGEAGQAIAQGLRTEPHGPEINCFDIKTLDPDQAQSIAQAASQHGVAVHGSLIEALQGASYVISTVTAGSAPEAAPAAREAARRHAGMQVVGQQRMAAGNSPSKWAIRLANSID